MRQLILAMNISLDGFVGGPNGELDWVRFSVDMDNTELPAMIARADTCLLGRSLYEGFSSYWPTAPQTNPNLSDGEKAFARWIDQAQKVVFSTTLEETPWNNARLARGDLAAEVAQLKQQPGGDIVTFGGAKLAQQLVRLGLVDEYQLALNPVILGQGLPLFLDGAPRQKLRLVSSTNYNEVVSLVYTAEREGV